MIPTDCPDCKGAGTIIEDGRPWGCSNCGGGGRVELEALQDAVVKVARGNLGEIVEAVTGGIVPVPEVPLKTLLLGPEDFRVPPPKPGTPAAKYQEAHEKACEEMRQRMAVGQRFYVDCTIDPDDATVVNITMRPINPFLVIETAVSDDVKLEPVPRESRKIFEEMIQKVDAEISKIILGRPHVAPNAPESSKGVPGQNQHETVPATLLGFNEPITCAKGLEATMPDETEEEFRERMKEKFAAKFGPDPTGTYVPISDPPKETE